MPIYIGGTEVSEIFIGSTEIQEVYVGSQLVYSASTAYTLAQGDNGPSKGFMLSRIGSLSPIYFDGLIVHYIIAVATYSKNDGTSYTFKVGIRGTNGANLGQNFIKSVTESSLPNGKLLSSNASYQQIYDYPTGTSGTSYLISEWTWTLSSMPSNWDGSGNLAVEIS